MIIFIGFCSSASAKKKYIYENGILLDIKIGQEYFAFGGVCSQGICTGGQGGSRDIYYPIIKVGEIAYLGKTKTKLNNLVVGQTLEVIFDKNKTTIYLKPYSFWSSGIEIVKKVKL